MVGSDPLVLGRVHRRASREQRLFFLAMNAPIAFRFVSRSDADAETMEGRRAEQRRVLEAAPVDRRAKNAEDTVDRRHLVSLPKSRLEPHDCGRLLERHNRQIAERRVQRLDVSADGPRALEPFRLDIVRVVAVEELGDGGNILACLWCDLRKPRVAPSHDLTEELRFPNAFGGLLRRDGFGRAPRERKVVDAHAPALAAVHHVKPPRMFASWTRSTPFLFADLSNSHRSSLWLRDSCGGSSTNPVEDICGMKPPSSNAESLRDKQAA
jgi:hypothetical protein